MAKNMPLSIKRDGFSKDLARFLLNVVTDSLKAVSPALWGGSVAFLRRSDAIGSIASYDSKKDLLKIFRRSSDNRVIDERHLVWTFTHELAHRVWDRLSDEKQDKFFDFVKTGCKPLDDKLVDLFVKQYDSEESIIPKSQKSLYSSFQFAFLTSPEKTFRKFLKDKCINPLLPSDYAQTSPFEAFAEIFAMAFVPKFRPKGYRYSAAAVKFVKSLLKEGKTK